jgi:DNA-binding CsgD family transcriptional regulator
MNVGVQIGIIDSGELSSLLGKIYDCALDPRGWDDVLKSLVDHLNCANGVIGLNDTTKNQYLLNRSVGIDQKDRESMFSYFGDYVKLWEAAKQVDPMTWPLDEPLVASWQVPKAVIETNRYVIEWASPRGYIDSIGFIPIRQPGRIGEFGFGRHVSRGVITDREVSLLRILIPHLRRSLMIGDLLDMQSLARASLYDVLDRLTSGIVFVDSSARIVHANSTAMTMLSAGDPIRDERGCLTLRQSSAMEALTLAITLAANNELGLGGRGVGVPLQLANGDPGIFHVLPLSQGELRASMEPRAIAAVFISLSNAPRQFPLDALTALYDLTPAESRVFAALANGMTKAEAADSLGVQVSTVHTHLMRIFTKTGTSRQTDLIRLVHSLSAPVSS